jgi:hypothetical protein
VPAPANCAAEFFPPVADNSPALSHNHYMQAMSTTPATKPAAYASPASNSALIRKATLLIKSPTLILKSTLLIKLQPHPQDIVVRHAIP